MRSGGEVDVVYYLQIKAPMERGADVASGVRLDVGSLKF